MSEWNSLPVSLTEDRLMIGNHQVMQRWEEPIMRAMVDGMISLFVSSRVSHVIEVGYGMGILARQIQAYCPNSHTIIEPHPAIVMSANEMKRDSLPAEIEIIQSFWQDAYEKLPKNHYSAIFYDIYPPNGDREQLDLCFMIRKMAPLLRDGGILTYYTGMEQLLPVDQMQALMECFSEVTLKKVSVQPYPDCEYFRGKQMIVPFARK